MTKIDLHNYEAFLLDYHEGNLNEQMLDALRAFALAHPELEIELDNETLPGIAAFDTGIDFKSDLKKINDGKDDDIIISYIENQLNTKQIIAFEKRLQTDANLQAQLNAYQKTILTLDTDAIVMNKALLLKEEDDLILNNSFIAYLENQLSDIDKIEFEKELKQKAHLEKELLFYKKTLLRADERIVHPNKAALKKEANIIFLFNTTNLKRMAAAVFLLFGLFVVYLIFKPGVSGNIKTLSANRNIQKGKTAATKVIVTEKPVNPIKNTMAVVSGTKVKNKRLITNPILSKENLPEQTKPYVASQYSVAKEIQRNDMAILPIENKALPIEKGDESKLKEFEPIENNTVVYTLATIETEKEMDENQDSQSKNKFWKKLLNIANKAKSIGVKGIETETSENKTFFVAFNSLSVEKK